MFRRSLALTVSLAALAVAAPTASAAWFAAVPVDGPAPITALGNVSLARDGGGAVAYVKSVGDNPGGYLSRFVNGDWHTPELVPGAAGVSDIAVAAGEDGRLGVVWISGGSVFASVADGAPGAPLAAPVVLSPGGGASNVDIQVGTEGGMFAVWSQHGRVRAAMLEGTTWTTIPAALNIDPAHVAGEGAGHPRVAVAADDTAVVTWGELDAHGVSHVYYRRLLGTTVSQFPKEVSVPAYGGFTGAAADSPRIDVEYDRSFAWVVFRETVGGRSRTFARRLRGSTFDPPVAIDGSQTSTGPGLDMNPSGEGITVTQGQGNTVLWGSFADKDFNPVARLDTAPSAAPQQPVAYFSDRGDGVVAYDRNGTTVGRLLPADKPEGEVTISSPTAGPVAAGTLRMSGDRVGDAAVAQLQGAAGARVLTIALEDIPPARPVVSDRTVNPRTQGIVWNAGLDQLGPQSFRVRVDGREVGTSTTTALRTKRVRDGRHIVSVTATDHRGQTATSRSLAVYTDTKKPRKLRVRTSRSGKLLRVRVSAVDPKGRGTGIRSYVVDWGDGHRSSSSRGNLRHRYSRSGRKRITVRARDRAGNEAIKRKRA